MEDATTDQLRTALSAYVDRAIALLADECGEAVVDGPPGMARWERTSSDAFILREPVEPGWRLCVAENEARLSGLPEYEAALLAIESDEVAIRHTETLVGTALSAHRVEKHALVNRLIWLVAERTRGLRFDDEAFAKAYEACRSLSLTRRDRKTVSGWSEFSRSIDSRRCVRASASSPSSRCSWRAAVATIPSGSCSRAGR